MSFVIQNDTITLSDFNPQSSLITFPNAQYFGVGTSNPQYTFDVIGTASFDNFADISNNTGSSGNVITKTSSNSIWSYNGYNMRGINMFPENTADTTTISNVTTLPADNADNIKWQGGVLAPNGKIYCIPLQASQVGIINPYTDTINLSTITGAYGGDYKWIGGVLAPNGKIYCIPWRSTVVGIIDPVTNTIDMTTITSSKYPSILTGDGKWSGGVLAPNGKIYFIPQNSTVVGIIDPSNNTMTSISGLPSDTNKWSGGVLAPNGKIYCIPLNSSVIGIINPVNDTIDTTTITLASLTNKQQK